VPGKYSGGWVWWDPTSASPSSSASPASSAWERAGRPAANVTLATHLSVDRILPLFEMRRRWTGPMVATFYARNQHDVEVFAGLLRDLPDVKFAVEVPNIDEHGDFTSYPINILRNAALRLVETEYVFMVDGDFVPSLGLYEYLLRQSERLFYMGNYTALVIPCFSVFHEDQPDPAAPVSAPSTKADAVELMLDLRIRACATNPDPAKSDAKAHFLDMDYKRWVGAEDWYLVPFAYPFEPYVVVKVACAPDYDRRFISYGDDKVSFNLMLHFWYFQYWVSDKHFVVHMPHPEGLWAAWTAKQTGERARAERKVKWLIRDVAARQEDESVQAMRCLRPRAALPANWGHSKVTPATVPARKPLTEPPWFHVRAKEIAKRLERRRAWLKSRKGTGLEEDQYERDGTFELMIGAFFAVLLLCIAAAAALWFMEES
jgi:hypothetical protein